MLSGWPTLEDGALSALASASAQDGALSALASASAQDGAPSALASASATSLGFGDAAAALELLELAWPAL